MKRKLIFLLALAAALCLSLMPVSSWAEDSDSYSDNSGTFGGHIYKVFNNGISWTQAKDFCEGEVGHLVTITSQEEQDFINEQLLSGTMKHCYWIGLAREKGTSTWRWVNGEEFSFANWARNEPNYMDSREDYAELFGKNFANSGTQKFLGEWNDATDTGAEYSGDCYALVNTGFICEWDSEVIVEPVEPVTLNTSSAKVAVGRSMILEAYGTDDIAFKSSNKAVATVSSTGKVSAVKPGTATITAYSKADKTNKATCKITVKYKLTYKMDGGTNSADNPTWYTGKVTLKDPKARKGYDFKGWYSDSNFKTRVRTVTNTNKTLYAKWEWHSYSIKFVKNGGTGSQYYQRCRYGKEFNLPECHYTRKGYAFTGWNTKADGSGKAYADKASFKNLTSEDGKTISFYAQWKVRKYTIKYSGLPEGAKNDNKTSYTINTATFSLKDASCPGYTFKGWFSDSKKTKPIASIAKGSTGSKTIYSKWTAHNYTIKFNANGGEGTTAAMKSCVYGKQYNLTKNGFQKKDYLFTGWNTQADGSGASYADGAAVSNLVTKNGGSITLYAQWEEDKYLLYWPVRNGTENVTTLSSNCNYYYNENKVKIWVHKGIDIANSAGASWYAAKGGTIYRVYTGCNTDANGTHYGEGGSCNPDYGYYGFTFYDAEDKPYTKNICNNGFGNGIVIQTDPIDGVTYYIQYAHMESVAFTKENEGQRITAGTYLGKVGNRGFSFGTHAHFEINKDKLFGDVVDNDYTHTEALAGEHDKCVFTYKYDW